MKITATQTVDVEISDTQAKKITLNFICQKYDWKTEFYIKDGSVYENVYRHTSHAWTEEVYIRTASEMDFLIEKLVKNIIIFK